MGYRCVQCSFPIKSLYVQYSPGNIRLMKCENCKAVADEYIECEIMILVIDLILHKPKAYRHLLYNFINQQTLMFQGLFWKLAFVFLLFDSYKCLVLESSKGKLGSSSMSFSSLMSTCWKMLIDVFFGNFMFLLTFFIMAKIFLHTSISISRCSDLLLALMISGYFKIFLIAMTVWEFPSSVIFIIDLFCLSSNAVALKVMTESSMSRCVWACFSAYAIKLFATQILDLTFWGQLIQGRSQTPSSFSLKPS
ncbi:PREDICTED: protein arv1 homolog isoform X1 [Lupinus angustifolius]|uniref:protein arv1 homolog isoform X1 n=1 Tax=Lupinus angustifolius TaxID=3871 RepID=UPI00092E9E31|nr:PREDICTED: protein arv1 homolog isoform X1 [Lupinus angustifolius]